MNIKQFINQKNFVKWAKENKEEFRELWKLHRQVSKFSFTWNSNVDLRFPKLSSK